MNPRSVGMVAVVVAASVGMAGCGSSDATSSKKNAPTSGKTIDVTAVESRIATAQKDKTPDLDVGPATCPHDVAASEGATFTCTIAIAGVIAPFRVTVTDASGSSGRFNVKSAKPIIRVSKAVDLIRSNLDPAAGKVDVSCGKAQVKVLEVGATFDCTVSRGADRQTVKVRVKDAEGTISISA